MGALKDWPRSREHLDDKFWRLWPCPQWRNFGLKSEGPSSKCTYRVGGPSPHSKDLGGPELPYSMRLRSCLSYWPRRCCPRTHLCVNCALILLKTLALYKPFTCLLTYLMLKVSYGPKCAPVSLSTYMTMRRWADLARDRRALKLRDAGKSSLRSAGAARRPNFNETTLIGRDIDVDGVTPSRMTSKPTSQTESAIRAFCSASRTLSTASHSLMSVVSE